MSKKTFLRVFSVALAAGFLACAGAKPKVPTLIKRLKDRDPAVKVRSANQLAGLGRQAEPAVPALLVLFKDTRRPVNEAAARAIVATGEGGIHALAAALSDRDAWVRCRAAEALGLAGPDAASAITALAMAVADHDFCVSGKASESLGLIGEASVPALLQILKNDNAGVRRLAADALARMGPAVQRRAAEKILPDLHGGDEFTRAEAAQRLASLGSASVTVFLDLLWDKDPDLRQKAIDGLSEIGDSSPAVVDALAGLFRDPSTTLRLRAAVVLGKFGEKDPAVLDRLTPLLKSPDSNTRRGAIQAIGHMGMAGAPAVEALVKILIDPSQDSNEDVTEALNSIGTREAFRAAENHARQNYLKQHSTPPPANPSKKKLKR